MVGFYLDSDNSLHKAQDLLNVSDVFFNIWLYFIPIENALWNKVKLRFTEPIYLASSVCKLLLPLPPHTSPTFLSFGMGNFLSEECLADCPLFILHGSFKCHLPTESCHDSPAACGGLTLGHVGGSLFSTAGFCHWHIPHCPVAV